MGPTRVDRMVDGGIDRVVTEGSPDLHTVTSVDVGRAPRGRNVTSVLLRRQSRSTVLRAPSTGAPRTLDLCGDAVPAPGPAVDGRP